MNIDEFKREMIERKRNNNDTEEDIKIAMNAIDEFEKIMNALPPERQLILSAFGKDFTELVQKCIPFVGYDNIAAIIRITLKSMEDGIKERMR